MSTQVQYRQGSAAANNAFTSALAQPSVVIDKALQDHDRDGSSVIEVLVGRL